MDNLMSFVKSGKLKNFIYWCSVGVSAISVMLLLLTLFILRTPEPANMFLRVFIGNVLVWLNYYFWARVMEKIKNDTE